MFGSNILETAIGLILVFLVMSLICSAMREALEGIVKHRAVDLERGIRELLQDPHGDGLARELYSHPLVFGLYEGKYEARPKRKWFMLGSKLPSYIPSANFARALIDLDQQGKIHSPAFKGVLRTLTMEAGDDIVQLRKNLEAWFDGAAERIGGGYKRRTQYILLAFGIGTAAALNVNAIVIAEALFHSAELRTAVTASAEKFVATNPMDTSASHVKEYHNSMAELHNLADVGLPMGWGKNRDTQAAWYILLFGWLVTGLAVTLGAPFWFDLLNRFVTLRSTIKPKPRADAEAAETPAAAGSRVAPASVERQVVRVGDVVATPVPLPPVLRDQFEPHEWNAAEPEEGVL